MYGLNNYNGYTANTSSMGLGALIWFIIAVVVSLAGCFIVYFLFVKKENKDLKGFLAWLREFLSFNKMLIEPILKISYIFFALLITLESFALISASFVSFLLMLVFGNILVRVLYEVGMITISIWKNTQEINKKMK